MGIFGFFRRPRPSPSPSLAGPHLPDALFTAAEAGDARSLAQLCRVHRQTILKGFPEWQTVPTAIRRDPAAEERYCRGLIAVAVAFQEAGDGSLIALLSGKEDDNPIVAWERDLSAAQEMLDGGTPERAARLLRSAISDLAGLCGSAVDSYLPRMYGMLGVALFHTGDIAEAVAMTRKAKALCEASRDDEGVHVYAANLTAMGFGPDPGDAGPRAAAAQAGDEKIVYADAQGRRLTLAELAGVTGTVNWQLVGRIAVPQAADRLHAEAREAGAAGEYARALDLLAEASRLAPAWPYPLYDAAFTHLLRGESAEAEVLYERVDGLAPRGFFTAKTALDCLRRERDGRLPPGAHLKLVSAEWAEDVAEKRRIVESLLSAAPDFPAALKELAMLEDDPDRSLAVLERGLACEPDPETEGILRINRALIQARRGERDRAIAELGALAVDPASTLGTAELAKAALAGVVDGTAD